MKYRNEKTSLDGIRFDSKKEAKTYLKLKNMQEEGKISELRLQVPFLLVPSQKGGLRTERPVKYIADFVYKDEDGNEIVVDSKGMRTPDYIIKRKLMKYLKGIEIVEV